MAKPILYANDPTRTLVVVFGAAVLTLLMFGAVAASQLKHLPPRRPAPVCAAPAAAAAQAVPGPVAAVAEVAEVAPLAPPRRHPPHTRHPPSAAVVKPPSIGQCGSDPTCGLILDQD